MAKRATKTTRDFTVLHDADDLACVEAECPRALDGQVLAFDTEIHVLLDQRGVRHLTPWEIVDYRELPELRAFEAAVWRHWTEHARIEWDGIDLLGVAAYRHSSALTRLAWAAYVLRRALEELEPERVILFDEPPAHGLDQPMEYRKIPLLFGLLHGAAERRGIPVLKLSRGARPGSGGLTNPAARSEQVRRPPVDVHEALNGRPYVVFQANRADLLRQLPLIGALRERLACQAVQLYKEASAEIVEQAAAEGHFVWHETQVARTGATPDIADRAAEARRAFDAAGRSAPEPLRALYGNRHIASHFDFLFGEYASKIAGHLATWKAFFARNRPAAFVGNSHAPIYDVAAAAGIPCLGLPHALMLIGDPRWYATLPSSSLVGALSESHRQRLVAAGLSASRIRVTGDPWVDELRDQAESRRRDHTQRTALRERLGLPAGRRVVLLCTSAFGIPSSTSVLPLIDLADDARCAHEIGRLARRRGDLAIVIKCHPRCDHPKMYEAISNTLPPDRRLTIVDDQPLGPLVELADVVCVWNTISSALVEASLGEKPVLVFARAMVWYEPQDWGMEAWPHFYDVDEFEAELETLFADEDYYTERAQLTQRALRSFLADPSRSSVSRCVALLREFLPVSVATD